MSVIVKNEIEKVLNASHTQANYPAVMIHTLLKSGGSASKTAIAEKLAKANKSENVSYFRGVPVFKRNKSIQTIVNISKDGKEEIYSIKHYAEISADERSELMRMANKKANEWECIEA
jgi:hypothetical protein